MTQVDAQGITRQHLTFIALIISLALMATTPAAAQALAYVYVDPDENGELTALVLQSTERTQEQIEKAGCVDLGPGGNFGAYKNRIRTIMCIAGEKPVLIDNFKMGCFYDMSALESVDLAGIDTSAMEDLSNLFHSCSSISTIDVSPLDTSSARSMRFMFSECTSLRSLDVSGFDTSKVDDFDLMFYSCANLEELDLASFDTSNATKMGMMFCGCSSLTSLDLSSFDTSNVEDFHWMFVGCHNLEELDLSSFVVSDGADTEFMLDSLWNLKKLTLGPKCLLNESASSFFDENAPWKPQGNLEVSITSPESMMEYVKEAKHAVTFTRDIKHHSQPGPISNGQSGTCLWSVDDEGKLVVEPINGEEGTLGDFEWLGVANSITSAEFHGTIHTQDCIGMFHNCTALESVDLASLDTSQVTDMSGMFESCHKLHSVDFSTFDTSRVASIGNMLACCYSLTSIDLEPLDGAPIETGCNFLAGSDLRSIHLGARFPIALDFGNGSLARESLWESDADGKTYQPANFPTGVSATYTRLTHYDEVRPYGILNSNGVLSIVAGEPASGSGDTVYPLTEFGYASAEEIPWHADRERIKSVRVVQDDKGRPGWFESLAYWFDGCTNLKKANVSALSSSELSSVACLFRDCRSLESVTLPTYLEVPDYSEMFRNCSSLTDLDLSGVDTGSATSMKRMLHGCTSLTTIKLGNRYSQRGASTKRLAGSEFPQGAWKRDSSNLAYLSDSIPSWRAGAWRKLSDKQLAKPGVTLVSVQAETDTGSPALQVESTIEDGVEMLDYTVSEDYPSDTLYVGDSPRASSTKTLPAATRTVTPATLRSVKNDSRITKVVVPSGVSAIAAWAFAGTNVKTLAVKSPKLTTAASVRNCLLGSKVGRISPSGMSAAKKKAVKATFSKWSGKKVK